MPDPATFAPASSRATGRRAFLRGGHSRGDEWGDYWIRLHRRAMACRFEITLASRDAAAVPAARDALNEIDRLEDQLSVFRETSVISRINREGSDRAVRVDETVLGLLQRCACIHRDTGGAFDITSTPLSRCWGFLQRQGRLPPPDDIEAARSRVGFDRVTLDGCNSTVRFAHPGVELNLGAIGKGFALDRVSMTMRGKGVRHALLSAGQSSVLAIGGRDGGWLVEVVSPAAAGARRPLAQVRLRNAAIGTSGAGEQFVVVDGLRYGHVIDPRTGWPAAGVASVSVIATSAAAADALSTAFLVGGAELAERYCREHAGVMALVTPEAADMPRYFGSHPGAAVAMPGTASAPGESAGGTSESLELTTGAPGSSHDTRVAE